MKAISFVICLLLAISLILLPTLLYCQYIEAVIPVGSYPCALVDNQNPSAPRVYCANYGDNTVTVIDAYNNQVISTIRVGQGPRVLAYNSTSNKVYCANQLSNEVSIINGTTNEVINTILVGSRPSALVCDSIHNKIYCANANSNTVSVIDGVNDNVITTINVGLYPMTLLFNSTNNKIYCANMDSDDITVIDGLTNQVIATIPVGRTPVSMCYNPTNNKVYCASWSNGRIYIINGATDQKIDSIIYGNSGPQALVSLPYNRIAYVNFTGDNIKLIDSSSDTTIATYQFPVGTRPYALSFSPNGFLCCANIGSNNISLFYYYNLSWCVTIDNISYPITPLSIKVLNYFYKAYIVNLWSATVTVICLNVPGIEEHIYSDIKLNSLTIYPNPAQSFFIIRMPQMLNQVQHDKVMLRMFDVSGKLIRTEEFKNVMRSAIEQKRNELRVDLKGISPGVYFLKLGEEALAKKLVITK